MTGIKIILLFILYTISFSLINQKFILGIEKLYYDATLGFTQTDCNYILSYTYGNNKTMGLILLFTTIILTYILFRKE